MVPLHSCAGELTVTQRLLSQAQARGARRALVGGATGRSYSYAELATTVRAAAAGLAWRGLQAGDVVGVHVPDAVCFVLATHAIRAAGGVPSPVATPASLATAPSSVVQTGVKSLG